MAWALNALRLRTTRSSNTNERDGGQRETEAETETEKGHTEGILKLGMSRTSFLTRDVTQESWASRSCGLHEQGPKTVEDPSLGKSKSMRGREVLQNALPGISIAMLRGIMTICHYLHGVTSHGQQMFDLP